MNMTISDTEIVRIIIKRNVKILAVLKIKKT